MLVLVLVLVWVLVWVLVLVLVLVLLMLIGAIQVSPAGKAGGAGSRPPRVSSSRPVDCWWCATSRSRPKPTAPRRTVKGNCEEEGVAQQQQAAVEQAADSSERRPTGSVTA